jgi:hypothetical protein
MNKKITTIILIVIISVLLAVYFTFSLYVFPQIYLSTRQMSKTLPMITNVTTSILSGNENLLLGESFIIIITSANLGDTADIQITSVSFPNLTSNIDDKNENDIINIIHHNFTQNPMFISVGNEIGSEYTGLSKTMIAKYEAIEFYNRPWTSNTFYEAQLEVKPSSIGNFVVFVKTVALPHIDNMSHYPTIGIRDQQQEFVNAYYVNVVKRG